MREEILKPKRALISVTDKTGVIQLAKVLETFDIEIISTGGTAKKLEEAGIKVIPIQEITGNPEAFGGRMKSISFEVGSGLLFRRYNEDDQADMMKLSIRAIDIVVCNLYPFEEAIKKNSSEDELVENIDIGGPTMIRAAAKNYEAVSCLTSPNQYTDFTNELLELKGSITFSTRKKLAGEAFYLTAQYDTMISHSFNSQEIKAPSFSQIRPLRYGENPHQKAWLALTKNLSNHSGIANAKVLQGKELSYNNLLDADASWKCNSDVWLCLEKNGHAVTVVKHANPCGVAFDQDPLEALKKAWASDPVSAFGSIITFSSQISAEIAKWLEDKFIEIVIAPSFSNEAKEIFSKKKNLRLLVCSPREEKTDEKVYRSIAGGLLIQEEDELIESKFANVTKTKFDTNMISLAHFGLALGKYLKSNAITLVAKDEDSYVLAGAGMGQPNRLDSLKMLAAPRAKKSGFDLKKVVLISDAFFPFRDSIEVAHEVGIKYIVQPGGSIRDEEVICACDEFNMAMLFTGHRHFRH